MDFQTILSAGVSLTLLIGGIWGAMHYIVLAETRPHKEVEESLRKTLRQLDNTVAKLDNTINRIDERQHETEKRLAIVEKTIDALHKRLDDTNRAQKKFAQFCFETHKKDANLDCGPIMDVISSSINLDER